MPSMIKAFIWADEALSEKVQDAWRYFRRFRKAERAYHWLLRESCKASECIGKHDAYFVVGKSESVDLGPKEETIQLLKKAQR